MEEMNQSLRIIEQALENSHPDPSWPKSCLAISTSERKNVILMLKGPRGSFGIRIISDGTDIPYRLKLRTPCFANLSLFEEASAECCWQMPWLCWEVWICVS